MEVNGKYYLGPILTTLIGIELRKTGYYVHLQSQSGASIIVSRQEFDKMIKNYTLVEAGEMIFDT